MFDWSKSWAERSLNRHEILKDIIQPLCTVVYRRPTLFLIQFFVTKVFVWHVDKTIGYTNCRILDYANGIVWIIDCINVSNGRTNIDKQMVFL